MSESPDSAKDGMQFEQAEFVKAPGMSCAACSNSIETTYWHLSGNVICPDCAAKVAEAQKTPQKGMLLRGALYALGMALACAIGYAAILIITNYELAIIAIGVGWAGGNAASKGSGGAGGRAVQVVAVIATYMAICFSLAIQIIYHYSKDSKEMGPVGWVVIFVISLGKPFLELSSEGFGGLIGILILFFGLQQAWKQTGNVDQLLMGPYQKEEEKIADATA